MKNDAVGTLPAVFLSKKIKKMTKLPVKRVVPNKYGWFPLYTEIEVSGVQHKELVHGGQEHEAVTVAEDLRGHEVVG